MEAAFTAEAMLAQMFGGWEIILMLAVILLLLGAKKLPGLARGFGEGIGGAFGRLVADALTHGNDTAEDTSQDESGRHAFDNIIRDMKRYVVWLAEGFGIGRIRFAPGTFGSLAGFVWFALLLAGPAWLFFLGAPAVALLAVWICGWAESLLGRPDPPSVVLDEIVAVPLCFCFWAANEWVKAGSLPHAGQFFATNWLIALAVFAAFRLFDIWKPWPIRQSQRLPGGWGVVVDDVLAAVYVNVVMAGGFWVWNTVAL